MAELTEQQTHLKSVIEQQQTLSQEVQQLNAALDSKRSMYTKLQGVREYLDQTGVTLPEPEEAPAEAVESEVVSLGSTYTTNNWKVIQVRTATIIDEDGTQLSKSFHRHVVVPGTVAVGSTTLTVTDVSAEDAGVQAIFNAVMTTDVKEAYRLNLVGIRSETNT